MSINFATNTVAKRNQNSFQPSREFIRAAVTDYLNNGGSITHLPYIEIKWLDWSNLDEFFEIYADDCLIDAYTGEQYAN